MLQRKASSACASIDAQELLEGGKASGEDLGHAADEMRDLAHTLRDQGMLDAAEEVEKLAGELDEAARLKLKADEQGSEQEVQHALGDASKDGHDLADKLKADGKEELGCVVEQVTVKVDGVVGGEHPDVQELQQTVCEAKDAAEKLREAGLPEEAAKMDQMVGEIEHALQAELKAEELRRAAAWNPNGHHLASFSSQTLSLLQRAHSLLDDPPAGALTFQLSLSKNADRHFDMDSFDAALAAQLEVNGVRTISLRTP